MKLRLLITSALVAAAATVFADPDASLLANRAETVVQSMYSGLKEVSASQPIVEIEAESAEMFDPEPSTYVSDCNLNTSVTPPFGQCYTVKKSSCVITEAEQCTSANCWTMGLNCMKTFPAECGTQDGARTTCSEGSCSGSTASPGTGCTVASSNCDAITYMPGCNSWTHARYMCKTDTAFCLNATLAPACGAQTAVVQCGDSNTYTRNCVNTVAGGDSCSAAGACLTAGAGTCTSGDPNTCGPTYGFGRDCMSWAAYQGMCGMFSAATGTACPSAPEEPDTEPLAAWFALISTSGGAILVGKALALVA